jgi:putative aminopeptidase FrvX
MSAQTDHHGENLRELLQTLSTLVRAPSVVGAETAFMRTLERELVLNGATVREYQGVLEATGSDPHSLIVSAHVDRHGIVCTGPNEYQYAAYVARSQGDLDGNSISEQTITTISERFIGSIVEAHDPWHGGYLGQGVVRGAAYCDRRRNLVFDLEGFGTVRPGTPFAYLQPLVIEGSTLSAQLDNVLSVAIVVDMFRRGFQGTALFAAEEEAGRSWRYVLNWFRRFNRSTRRLIVMDTSPYPDSASASRQDLVLRRRDANGDFDAELVERLRTLCDTAGVRSAFKDEQIDAENRERVARGERPRSLGRTELGRLVAGSGGAITGATLQLPTVGYHTPREKVSMGSLRAAVRVTDALMSDKPGVDA